MAKQRDNSQLSMKHANQFHLQRPNQAPQAANASMKTNSLNQYRGHGRGQ